jgi:UDP-4-amino-4-deoxy-L-arabinose-oxoglutarate aminotransferase
MRVDFYRHDLDPSAAKAIARVIETPFLTSGAIGQKVEQQLAAYFGVKHAALVNSCTSGMAASLLALDIGPGDEVIVPAMTFIATSNVVELVGARPVFVDVDPETLLLTPGTVAQAITARTKAVIPVHLYGQMVDIAALRSAIGSDIAIIEDSAHCFEGEYAGSKPGAHSTCAAFSFYAVKNVTCGEGGAIVTNDTLFYKKFLQTRLHGMSAGAIDRFKGNTYRHWDMERLGTKANLPDILAALLPEQIDTISQRLPKRERIAQIYEAALATTVIRFPKWSKKNRHARHLFVIHVPPSVRDDLLVLLGARNIGCTVNYQSVPTLTYYREKYGYDAKSFPVSYNWGAGTLTLPLYPSLASDAQDYVIDVLRREAVPLVERALRTG